jgi:hypothetical protein
MAAGSIGGKAVAEAKKRNEVSTLKFVREKHRDAVSKSTVEKLSHDESWRRAADIARKYVAYATDEREDEWHRGTYRCTNCGNEIEVGRTRHLPPCPSCGNGEWESLSGDDSVDDPYPDR